MAFPQSSTLNPIWQLFNLLIQLLWHPTSHARNPKKKKKKTKYLWTAEQRIKDYFLFVIGFSAFSYSSLPLTKLTLTDPTHCLLNLLTTHQRHKQYLLCLCILSQLKPWHISPVRKRWLGTYQVTSPSNPQSASWDSVRSDLFQLNSSQSLLCIEKSEPLTSRASTNITSTCCKTPRHYNRKNKIK